MAKTRWIDLLDNTATYISPVYEIESSFDAYISEIISQYDENGGFVNVYVRLQYDDEIWSEWIRVDNVQSKSLFKDDFYSLSDCKFQYRVELTDNGGKNPVFKGFLASMNGAYIVDNIGDVIYRPELWIKKINGSGDISIINETNGQTLTMSGLNNGETVYIDCENEDIVSDLPNTIRYDNHNNVFLELEIGENVLTGKGDFELVMRYEFKTLQG